MTNGHYQSGTERVQVWADASSLHIRFNNPARHNALSVDMWEAIPGLLSQAESDSQIRLVVFSGAGEKAFVSGADISQFEDMRAAKAAVARYEEMAETALMAIYNCKQPTLSCIRGFCIGGGVNVAISCDIRIASADSVFSVPAARLGLGYRYSAMKNLVDLIGPGAAKDLFFTARRIDAVEPVGDGAELKRAAIPDDGAGRKARGGRENCKYQDKYAHRVCRHCYGRSRWQRLSHIKRSSCHSNFSSMARAGGSTAQVLNSLPGAIRPRRSWPREINSI